MNNYILNILKDIMAIDSPSGYTKEVIDYCEKEALALGYKTSKTKKGNLIIDVEGQDDYTIGFCAHVDTLGLMVRSIQSNGTLAFTAVGGPIIPTLDGEYCRVITRNQKVYTGLSFQTILLLMFLKNLKMPKENVKLCIFVLMKK